MEKIIEEIKKAIKSKGISATRAAIEAGLEQSKVSRLLSGRTKRLDPDAINALRNSLGMISDGSNNLPMQVNGGSHHIDIHHGSIAKDPEADYSDPIAKMFLNDWLQLSDVDRLRIWTLVKEKLAAGG